METPPVPLPQPSESRLQVGIKDGFVVIGINGKPIAKFTGQQAGALGALLIRHALSIAFGTGEDMVKKAADEVYDKDKNLDQSDN